ncbi:MAG: hypothetical protein KAJ91_04290 [Candidatus Aenigmarchaeota archaeon]|nr:hypothetical protein [Candidatus Aenigmarchaeota archaeon]MCK5334318.1 hypothetical protein [Candidatus Aenigmarchaeota archaeon]
MESKIPKLDMSLEVMNEIHNLQRDISFLNQRVKVLEDEVGVVDGDMREVRPEYLKKLDEIEKGKFYRFKTVEGLRKDIENF